MFNNVPKGNSQKAIVSGGRKRFLSGLFCWLVAIALCLSSPSVKAQCAMCRAALETEEGKGKAAAVNDGIVYLMAFPYLLVGGLGYYVYRTRLQKKK